MTFLITIFAEWLLTSGFNLWLQGRQTRSKKGGMRRREESRALGSPVDFVNNARQRGHTQTNSWKLYLQRVHLKTAPATAKTIQDRCHQIDHPDDFKAKPTQRWHQDVTPNNTTIALLRVAEIVFKIYLSWLYRSVLLPLLQNLNLYKRGWPKMILRIKCFPYRATLKLNLYSAERRTLLESF